jgi:single-stranded DNA-binding protein
MSIECALFGILGRDAESKVSKNGKPYLRLNVRVGDGDSAQWASAMVFDADAIAIIDRLVKGARVYVEGSITLNEWTGQDGEKRAGLNVSPGIVASPQSGGTNPSPGANARRQAPMRRRRQPGRMIFTATKFGFEAML